MEIKRLGSYQEVDAQGYLIKLADASKIQDEWAEVLNVLKKAYLQKWGDAVHSIYVRGSLAKGWAVKGVSDVDSVIVFRENAFDETDSSPWLEKTEKAIKANFPFVADVEAHYVRLEDATDPSSVDACIIKLEAVCIYGEDLAAGLPGYKPGPDIAFQTRYFQTHFDLFLEEYPNEPEDEKADFLNWMLRRFLRLGMELVMEREQKFTRDLYLCYESFSKHYPDKQEEMYRALELAVNPVISAESFEFIQHFGEWLVSEAQLSLRAANA